MNKADRWHRISGLFDRVVELPAPDREAVLSAECADDPHLRTEVERLLQADERTSPVDRDIAGQASNLLLEGDPHEHEGQQFGPYRIVKLLAQGGMGRVYLAEREGEDFAQTVALKLVGGYGNFDAYTARRRFLDERRILARLQHPNIARLLDGGVGPEAQPWFAMEYVDGAPLTDWCDQQQLDVRQRLTLFAKVCEAVDHAHRFLIVHRDLKPGNVLVDQRGEPKVLDFGIAKLLDEGGPGDRTGSTILMTPDYAAPEQIRGGQISTATDVYALGAVLFEVLTGRKPFVDPLAPRDAPQASKAATEGQHTGERASARSTTPHALRKHLRGDIDRILRTALDPDPARRYGSAATLGQDLRAVAEGKAISLRSDRAYRIGVFLRRHKWETAAATAAVLALLGTTGMALRQQQQALANALQAERHAATARKEALASQQISELLISAFDAADPIQRKTLVAPSAKDILDASAANIGEKLQQTPELKARMQTLLGRAYQNLGHPDNAAEQLDAAIKTSLELKNPAQAAKATMLLAQVEMDREQRKRAIELARQAVALYRQSSVTPQEQLEAHTVLGMALIGPKHATEAAQVLATTYELIKQVHGEKSIEAADSLNDRGFHVGSMGDVRTAEALLRQAMRLKAEIKANPASFYATRGLLAINLRFQAKYAEAEKLFLQNHELTPALYPNGGSSRVNLDKRLGALYRDWGNLVSAQRWSTEAVKHAEESAGKDGLDTGVTAGFLAEILDARGDTANAERHYRLSVEVVDGPNVADGTRLRTLASYGGFLSRHRKSGVPRDDLEKNLDQWIATFGVPGEYMPFVLAEAKFIQVEHRVDEGRWDDAEAALPADDPNATQPLIQARRHYWKGRIRSGRGDFVQAIAEYRKAIEMNEAFAGRESANGALWRLDYAQALQDSGKREQAQAQIELVAPVLRKQMVPHAPALVRLDDLRRRTALAAK